MSEWTGFPKIARLNRDCVVTEKVDGTNAAILIQSGRLRVYSKSEELTGSIDSYGFYAWVMERKRAILDTFEDGLLRGEFAGPGINRNRHQLTSKTFYCFAAEPRVREGVTGLPDGFNVVPVLYEGPFDTAAINREVDRLRINGSLVGGTPEGVVVFHLAGSVGFKVTCLNDNTPKSRACMKEQSGGERHG